jgi:uncharacterized membrane protein
VFSLAAVLAAEWALVRRGMAAADIRRLARVDGAYGAVAGVVIIAGVSRVIWGAKPAEFYLESTTFWLKMAAVAAVALLSIRPTIRYIGWRRALDADPSRPAVGPGGRVGPPDDQPAVGGLRADPDVRGVDGAWHRRLRADGPDRVRQLPPGTFRLMP